MYAAKKLAIQSLLSAILDSTISDVLQNSNVALFDDNCVACQYQNHDVPSLKSLHLASVKTNLEVYGLIDIHATLFQPFKNLQTLSLDYDYLSNQLLQVGGNKELENIRNILRVMSRILVRTSFMNYV